MAIFGGVNIYLFGYGIVNNWPDIAIFINCFAATMVLSEIMAGE